MCSLELLLPSQYSYFQTLTMSLISGESVPPPDIAWDLEFQRDQQSVVPEDVGGQLTIPL